MSDHDNAGNPPSEDIPDERRRDFLEKGTLGLAAVGVAVACWPFIASMNPSRTVRATAIAHVDIGDVAPGQVKTMEWQGKPVFVFHRTDKQISAMRASTGAIDPEPDEDRVIRPEYLVVVGLCTHLGCVPRRAQQGGWLCPCHASTYDDSGRVLSGPAPRNLEVPEYRFEDEHRIVIG